MKKKLKKCILLTIVAVLCCYNICFAKATDSEIHDEIVAENISSVSEVEEIVEESDLDEIYEEEPEEDEVIASVSEIDEDIEPEEEVEISFKTSMFGAGNTYNTDQFLKDIESKKPSVLGAAGNSNITKITFVKGGSVPSGEKIHIVSGDIGVYLDGTEITVYTPDTSDVIKLSEFNWSSGRGFADFTNLVSIEGLENLDATSTYDFTRMFEFDYKLESIDLSKLGNVTVSETSMMFIDCESLETINLGTTFDTSNVSEMRSMFHGCKSLVNIDIEHLNTSSSVSYQHLFTDCASLTSLDLSSFDSRNIITMYGMFEGCKNIETITLSNSDTQNLSDIALSGVFSGCENLQNIYNLEKLKTGNVQLFNDMFKNCKSLTNVDLRGFDTGKSIAFNSMFENCIGINSLDLTSFNTKICNQMIDMFKGCINLNEIKVSNDFVLAPVSSGYNTGVPASGNSGIFTYTGPMITFKANGGLGTMLPQPAATSGDTILKNNTFSRSGYTFSSWLATNSNVYANGANIGVVTYDITLTAQWTYVGSGDSGNTRRESYRSSGGGGGAGGGGGGGGVGIPANTSVPVTVNNTTATKAANSMSIDSAVATITKDLISGKNKMTISVNGVDTLVTNMFVTLNSVKVDLIDGNEKLIQVSDTYFLNENGEIVTGWLKTADGGWYFFDVFETNLGKEVINEWKQVSGDWYYFDATGRLLQGTITPDGYLVDNDGKMVNNK